MTALIEERDHSIELKRTDLQSLSRQLACEITVLLHRFDKTVVKKRVAATTELESTAICIVAVCVLCDRETAAVSDVSLKFVRIMLWLHVIHSHGNIICIPWQPLVNHCSSQKRHHSMHPLGKQMSR